jgi:hypothetical protein
MIGVDRFQISDLLLRANGHHNRRCGEAEQESLSGRLQAAAAVRRSPAVAPRASQPVFQYLIAPYDATAPRINLAGAQDFFALCCSSAGRGPTEN